MPGANARGASPTRLPMMSYCFGAAMLLNHTIQWPR
jgi:hypothetical protein